MSTGSNPFEAMERMIDQMRSQFDQAARAWESESGSVPGVGGARMGVDLADSGEAFVVTADVPGFDADEIDLQIRGRTLEITATQERSSEEEAFGEDATVLRSERSHRSMREQVTLPEPVRDDEAEATLTNGVLTVEIPKAGPSADEGHRIDIE